MSKLETNTIDNISGSSTLNIGDTNATTLNFDTGITSVTNIPSDLKNTPAFFAHANGNQDITNNTDTKVEIDTEILDSDGKFDTSNNRFTPTVAGYYIINGIARFDTSTTISSARIKIYKNGSNYYEIDVFKDTEDFSLSISQVVYLDTDDYVELYVRQNSGSTLAINGSDPLNSVSASFSGYKLIGA
jgi:hypothetical protein